MAGEFFRLSYKDSSREVGRTEFNLGPLTAGTLAGALTQMGALATAIQDIVLGLKVGSGWGDNDTFTGTTPTDPNCQRGIKWTVLMRDNVTGVPVINHIPTAKLSLLPTVGGSVSEDLDLTAGVGAAFKSAAEALVKSPAGNAVTVERVYYSD